MSVDTKNYFISPEEFIKNPGNIDPRHPQKAVWDFLATHQQEDFFDEQSRRLNGWWRGHELYQMCSSSLLAAVIGNGERYRGRVGEILGYTGEGFCLIFGDKVLSTISEGNVALMRKTNLPPTLQARVMRLGVNDSNLVQVVGYEKIDGDPVKGPFGRYLIERSEGVQQKIVDSIILMGEPKLDFYLPDETIRSL